VEPPYAGGAFSMTLLVPEEGKFRKFEEAVTAENLPRILNCLHPEELQVFMPKFMFRSKFSLAKPGMPSTFSC
jgi:serine protease inhibitor